MIQKIRSASETAPLDAKRQAELTQRFKGIAQSKTASEYDPLILSAQRAYEQVHKKDMGAMRKLVLQNSVDQLLSMLIRSNVGVDKKQILSAVSENIWDIDNPVSMLFNLLSIVIPGYTFMELYGVQPMPTKKSPIVIPQLTANNTRNGITQNELLLGYNGWTGNNYYTSNRTKESVTNQTGATFTYTTAGNKKSDNTTAAPLLPGKVKVQVIYASGTGSFTVTDDGEGHFVDDDNLSANGTVVYETGVITLPLNTALVAADVVKIDARWDLDSTDPAQVIFEFSSKEIEAEPFRVRTKYRLDNFYSVKKTLAGATDFDLAEMIGTTAAGYINKEISGQLIEDLIDESTGVFHWDSTPPTGVSWAFNRYSLIQPLINARNTIRKENGRCGGNIVVASDNLINTIEGLGKDVWEPVSYNGNEPIGPYVAGELCKIWKVIKNQDLGSSYMTWKKSDVDAAAFAGVHVGLYSTQPLAKDSLDVVQGSGALIGALLAFPDSVKEILVEASETTGA